MKETKINKDLLRSVIDKIEFSKPYELNGDSVDYRYGYIKALTNLGILDGLSAARMCMKVSEMEGWKKEAEENSDDVFYKEVWTRQDVVEALEEEGVETSIGNIDQMMEIAREAFAKLGMSNRNELLRSLVEKFFKEEIRIK